MNNIIIFVVFILSFGLTYFVRKFAVNKNIIDSPNDRSSHTVPTPCGGGLAIVLAFYCALLIFYLSGQVQDSIFIGLLGLVIIAIIGFIDDHNHIPARYRLIVHFAAAIWACYWLGVLPWTNVEPGWLEYGVWGISVLYLVWLLNLYNFMDGIDGIATVEAITVVFSASLLLSPGDFAWQFYLMMALVAAIVGFLFWNWPPAKIFMGDVGSTFIGILIGALSLITANNGSLDFAVWVILLAVFFTDASYTLLVRLLRGEKIYQAHRSHAYQHLSIRYGHKFVTIGVFLINVLWLLPLAWLGSLYSQFLIIFVLIAYAPLILLVKKYHAGLPS